MYERADLPEGAAKHLLAIQDIAVRDKLANILSAHKAVSPATLPTTLPPFRGLGDEHVVNLEPNTSPVVAKPYR